VVQALLPSATAPHRTPNYPNRAPNRREDTTQLEHRTSRVRLIQTLLNFPNRWGALQFPQAASARPTRNNGLRIALIAWSLDNRAECLRL